MEDKMQNSTTPLWAYEFSQTILSRGRNYYRSGRVTKMTVTGNTISALVRGTRLYSVNIENPGSKDPLMSCTCPYGANCKHIAAVLYKWEAEGRKETSAKTSSTGLSKAAAAVASIKADRNVTVTDPLSVEYLPDSVKQTWKAAVRNGVKLFFNLPKLLSEIKTTRGVCQDAAKIVNEGKAHLTCFDVGYLKERLSYEADEVVTIIRGIAEENGHLYDVQICLSPSAILSGGCRCGSNYYQNNSYGKQLCEHQLAILYLAYERFLKFNPGDETDSHAADFLKSFGKTRVNRQIDEANVRTECISLKPKLCFDDMHLELSFKIGIRRFYSVKDISELIRLINDNGSIKLGKSEELHFVSETFVKESLPILEYLKTEDARRSAYFIQYNSENYNSRDMSKYSSIQLDGERLDNFYELMKSSSVEFEDKMNDESYPRLGFDEGTVSFAVTIKASKGKSRQIKGVIIEGKVPLILDGKKYHYVLESGSLTRLDPDEYNILGPFDNANLYPFSYGHSRRYSYRNSYGRMYGYPYKDDDDEEGEYGMFSMKIGMKSLSDFYYNVLPELREKPYITVNEPDADIIEKALPAKARFDFYLDSEYGTLKCIGRADYGGNDRQRFISKLDVSDLPIEPFRSFNDENKAADLILSYFPEYDHKKHEFSCNSDDDTAYKVLDSGIKDLMSVGEVHCTDAFRRLRIRSVSQIKVGVSVESDLMNLKILSTDLTAEELAEVLASYRAKKKYHRLKNGDFIDFSDSASLETVSAMLDNLKVPLDSLVKDKISVPLYRAMYLDKMLEDHDDIAQNRDRTFRSLIKEFKTIDDSDFDVPESLNDTMREYQKYGYKWIRALSQYGFGGILADDMGLGKTLQVIAVLLAEKQTASTTSLVVCPASLVYNWQEEFTRFAPEIRTATVTGTLSERKKILEQAASVDVLITSYDLLKRDAVYYKSHKFRWQIADEAQFIKNPKSSAAKAVKIINSNRRIALTGTPIENRLSEMWSIFDFLMPGFLFKYDEFRTKFETPIAKSHDADATERLQKMVAPFILRRLKKDVLKDLPDKIEEVRYAKLEGEQRKLYDAQVLHMQKMLEMPAEELSKSRIQVLAELTKIRQICCDPSLLSIDYNGESAKREACLQLIMSAMDGGHRMLVFSQFTSMLSLLMEDLDAAGIRYYLITGATSKEERIHLVHEFNDGECQTDLEFSEDGSAGNVKSKGSARSDDNSKGVSVFLISLKAGGTGLNLTGADVVIHYDPWWNVAAQNQATDRAHRIGQTKTVAVYRLIAKDTIEEKIMDIQENKKDLADAILSGEQQSLGQLSRDELMDLLKV